MFFSKFCFPNWISRENNGKEMGKTKKNNIYGKNLTSKK